MASLQPLPAHLAVGVPEYDVVMVGMGTALVGFVVFSLAPGCSHFWMEAPGSL